MPINLPPEHPRAIEERKWEKPWSFVPFPMMLYKAQKTSDGRWSVGDPHNEQFSARCQMTVESESAMERAIADGWRKHPREALDYCAREEERKSTAAANRHYEDRNLSDAAKAEAVAADEETHEHVPEVPVKRLARKPARQARASA
jgi:hypothetical protein